MNAQEVLEASIVDEPPPFPSIDELVARERRRRRAHRAGAAVAGTAGVVAAVLVVTLVTSQLATVRTPAGGTPATVATESVPANETPQARHARLSDLLRARVATVLPGATLASVNPSHAELFGDNPSTMYAGYDYAEAALAITAPGGSTQISISVVRPLVPPRPQPTRGVAGRLFGGCAGEWSTSTPALAELDRCEDRIGPGGTKVSVAERLVGTALFVTVAFPDGGVVTVATDPAATLLTPDDLVEIVADVGYVAGTGARPHEPAIVDPTDPQALRTLPVEPEIDRVYPFDLYTHCGLDLVRFAERTWRVEPPYDGDLPVLYLAGTLELLDHATARFVVDQRHFPTDREVIMFYWAPSDGAPRCA